MVSSLIVVFVAILGSSIQVTEAFIKLPSSLSGLKAPSLVPNCEYNNKTATCCSALANMTQSQLCATFNVNLNELNVKVSLSFNNETLVEKKVEIGRFCVPLGGVTPLMACLEFYWVEIGFKDGHKDFISNICFQGTVSMINRKLGSVDFQCLRFEDGRFSRNADHQPIGKLCYPIPLGIINSVACLDFYYVEIGYVLYPDDMKCNICFQGSVSNLATVDFQCLRYENGTFSRNNDHKPTNKGWINFDVGK